MLNLFPYTDAHELNLDWVVEQVKANNTKVKDLTHTVENLHFDFDSKADKANTYTKGEVDTLLLTKANVSDLPDMSNYYDKTETDTLLSAKADSSSLASVATSGNYNDLTNKPTIPAAQVNSDWDAVSGVAQILNKPTLAAVATSGSYNDLNNKPTIPAAQVNSDWNATSGIAQILNKPTDLWKWEIKYLNGETQFHVKLNNVTFGRWTRYAAFYLATGNAQLEYGIFMVYTANGVPNVTYYPIITQGAASRPTVTTTNIENGKIDFYFTKNGTYDYMYMSTPEGGLIIY